MLSHKNLIKCITTKFALLAVIAGTLYIAPTASFAFIPPDDKIIDFKSIVVMQPIFFDPFSKANITSYVPTNMSPTTNQPLFMTQMSNGFSQKVAQSFQDYIMKSPMVKDSGVTKTVENVQKVTSPAMAMTSSSGITHKFALDVRYAERKAIATYEGYFKLTTVYDAGASTMVTTFAKPLNKTTSITLVNNSPAGSWNQNATLGLTHTF